MVIILHGGEHIESANRKLYCTPILFSAVLRLDKHLHGQTISLHRLNVFTKAPAGHFPPIYPVCMAVVTPQPSELLLIKPQLEKACQPANSTDSLILITQKNQNILGSTQYRKCERQVWKA